jgi:hypothetical protein
MISDSLGLASTCSHPVLERKPDGFDYCYFCGAFVQTMDEE